MIIISRIIFINILIIFSNFSYAGWFETMCEYTKYKDVPIATRIPDNRLPTGYRQQVWRDPNLKSGECLRHMDEGLCYISGINNAILFNDKGYSSSEWYSISKDPFEATHCKYCYDLNQGKPNSQTVNAYLKMWVGYKYTCTDSQGVYGENFEGCFDVKWEKQEYIEKEPCMQYICLETDEGDQHGIYSCQVQCPEYNNTSVYDIYYGMYVCRPSPEPPPVKEGCETKAGVFDCFADDVTNKLENNYSNQNSIFDNIIDGFKHLFDNFDFTKKEENEDDEVSEHDLNKLNANLPITDISRNINKYSLFGSSAQCPADNVLNIMGSIKTFSYTKLCAALSLISNLVLLLAFFYGYKLLRDA